MIGTGQAYIPPKDQSPISGRTVADMIGGDVTVDESGKVEGTIHYLSDVAEYEGEAKAGHYFPLRFADEFLGKKLHVGGSLTDDNFAGGIEITPTVKDPYLTIRVENCTDGRKIKVWEYESKQELFALDFSVANLDPAPGAVAASARKRKARE